MNYSKKYCHFNNEAEFLTWNWKNKLIKISECTESKILNKSLNETVSMYISLTYQMTWPSNRILSHFSLILSLQLNLCSWFCPFFKGFGALMQFFWFLEETEAYKILHYCFVIVANEGWRWNPMNADIFCYPFCKTIVFVLIRFAAQINHTLCVFKSKKRKKTLKIRPNCLKRNISTLLFT